MTLKIQDFWYFFKTNVKIFPVSERIIRKILHNTTETKDIAIYSSYCIKVLNFGLV